MPHSSGGGSHSGGFHSGSGGSRSQRVSTHYFPGARRYIRHNHTLGKDEYVYASTKPTKTSLASVIAISIFAAFFSGVSIFGISTTVPKKLDPEYNDSPRIYDEINVIEDEDALQEKLDEYQELTGICTVIYTVYDEDWSDRFHSLNEYAFKQYLVICLDEQHWVFVYSVPLASTTALGRAKLAAPAYAWEAVQGDDTDAIITDDFFVEFGKIVQENLESGKGPGTAFEKAFDHAVKDAEKRVVPGPSRTFHLLFMYLPIIVVCGIFIPVIILMIRKYKQDKDVEYEEVPLEFEGASSGQKSLEASSTASKAASVFGMIFLIPFFITGAGLIISGVIMENNLGADAAMGSFMIIFGAVWSLICIIMFVKMLTSLRKSKNGEPASGGFSAGGYAETYSTFKPQEPAPSRPAAPSQPQVQTEFDPTFFSSSKSEYEEEDDDFKRMKRQGYE